MKKISTINALCCKTMASTDFRVFCPCPSFFLETAMSNDDPVVNFLQWKRHNQGRSEATVDKYAEYLQRFAEFLRTERGGKSFFTAKKDDIEEFSGVFAHKQGISPRSRRPMVALLRGFFAWMQSVGLRADNPAATLSYPKAGNPLPRSMELKNAEKILMQPDLNTFIGVRDATMIAVLAGCGLRVSGLVSLNESSLIWTEHKGQEWLLIKVTEKGKKERIVPAPHEVRLLMRAYLGHSFLKEVDRTLPNGDKVLFINTINQSCPPHEMYGENRRLSRDYIKEIIWKYGKKAGVPKDQCHPHALRHLYGTELAEEDTDLLKIQSLMGHVDAKTTEVYVRLAMRKLSAQVDKANPLRKMNTPVSGMYLRE